MNRDKTPCIDCADREVGCHAKCRWYKDWKEQHEAERKKQIDAKKIRHEYADYKKNVYSKMSARGVAHYRQNREKGIHRDVDTERTDTGRMEDS